MATSSSQPTQISVDDLTIGQLVDVRKQLEEELTHLSNSLVQLRAAQTKFQACIENVKEIGSSPSSSADKPILVPLTNSCYVPGKLVHTDKVIIDIGTGYLVQKTREQAISYYKSKVDFIKGNVDKLDDTITKKRENLTMLVGVLSSKVQAQQQQHKPQP